MKSLVNTKLALLLGSLISQHAAAAFLSSTTPLLAARGSQTATLLTDGRLLVAGGQTNGGVTLWGTGNLYPPPRPFAWDGPLKAHRPPPTATIQRAWEISLCGR